MHNWQHICSSFIMFFIIRKIHINVANALNRQSLLIITYHYLIMELVGFESFKDQHNTIWHSESKGNCWVNYIFFPLVDPRRIKCLLKDNTKKYHIVNSFVFKRLQLCLPRTSLKDHIIKEFHERCKVAHARHDKPFPILMLISFGLAWSTIFPIQTYIWQDLTIDLVILRT